MGELEQRAWFRPKRYGYGAEPANWKGWLATGMYLAVTAGIVWRLVSEQALPAPPSAVLWWAALIVVTLAFVGLCWMKTDEKWRWRWGQDAERQ